MKNGPYNLIVAPKNYPGRLYRARYAYEHHVVYWRRFKRCINSGEVIHHINGNKRDNRAKNLELTTNKEHSKSHGLARGVAYIKLKCSYCKTIFRRPKRQFKPWYSNHYCNRRCMGKGQGNLNK